MSILEVKFMPLELIIMLVFLLCNHVMRYEHLGSEIHAFGAQNHACVSVM
jgi:ribose/xylose/arabinose/galactoside ABC-type transport system permease subunit